jgi:hypothetical protein
VGPSGPRGDLRAHVIRLVDDRLGRTASTKVLYKTRLLLIR